MWRAAVHFDFLVGPTRILIVLLYCLSKAPRSLVKLYELSLVFCICSWHIEIQTRRLTCAASLHAAYLFVVLAQLLAVC